MSAVQTESKINKIKANVELIKHGDWEPLHTNVGQK